MKTKLPLLLILFLTVAIACQRKAAGSTTDMSADQARKELTKGTWTLTNLNGGPVMMEAGQQVPSITFAQDGSVSGFTGCNPMAGTYTLEDGFRLRFNDVAVGLSACPASKTEKAFIEAINTTDNFTVLDDVLSLNVARRAPLATLTLQVERRRQK